MSEVYSDIDIEFNFNKRTGDINKKKDYDSIKQSLWCLLQTCYYDRKWHPEIGSHFPKMLFDNAYAGYFHILEDQIKNLISSYEPRISVSNVAVYYKTPRDEDLGAVSVDIFFSTVELGEKKATFYIERTR